MRRAIAQLPLLVAVWAVLVAGSALVGTCALLLTTGREQSLTAAAARFDAAGTRDQVAVTVGLGAPDPATDGADGAGDDEATGTGAQVAEEVVRQVTDALAPFAASSSVWAASEPARLEIDGPVRLGYLVDADTLTGAEAPAALTAGRWPRAAGDDPGTPLEVVVPEAVATALDVELGGTLTLAATAVDPATRLVVVGLVEWSGGQRLGRPADAGLPVEGPFLVAPGTLIAGAREVARLSVVADPDLVGSPSALAGVGADVAGLRGDLDDAIEATVPGRLDFVTVRSGLPGFVDASDAEQGRTAAILVTVVLLVLTLTAAALGQVTRLVVARRAAETALLVDRGAGRRRLAGRALGEALVIGLAATAVAVPAALLGYRALVAGPRAEAWRTSGEVGPTATLTPALTPVLVASVGAVAALQVAIAVGAAVRVPATRRRRAVGTVARSGLDVALVALAVLGYLQLRAHRPSGAGIDPVLALAPVLCVLAGAALVLRLLPAVVRLAELRARRSRGLVAPLAAWHVARGRATSGVFLLVVATTAATLALGYSATWLAAQQDQADAATGADVVVPADAPDLPAAADGSSDAGAVIAAAEAAAGGPVTAMAVTHRPAGLGSRVGGVTLVAVDTARAGGVLRGRLPDGRGWDEATRVLTPEPTAALALTPGARVVVTGAADEPLGPAGRTIGAVPVEALVELVLADPAGGRTLVTAGTVRLDGEPHTLALTLPRTDGWQLVAVDATLTTSADLPFGLDVDVPVTLRVEVTGTGEGDAADGTGGEGTWTVATTDESGRPGQPLRTCGEVSPAGARIDAACRVPLFSLGFGGADLLVTGFPAPETVPVLLPQALAEDLAATVGDELSLGVGTTTVPATVAGTVPYVPGATDPGTVLVDTDALTRALVVRGALEPTTDAWWLATTEPGAVASALGGTARDELATELRSGPLRVAVPAGLWLLVAAAVLLAVAGAAAQAASVTHERGLETARLRSIGVPRRQLVATGLVQHLLVTAGAVGAGALLGGLLTAGLSPVLVLGPTGGAAVPAVQVAWPWAALAVAVAGLLVGCVAVAVPAVVRLTRRADVTALRLGDAA